MTSAVPSSKFDLLHKLPLEKKFAPIVLYGTINNTFFVNGCQVTITHGVAYVFDDQTFILTNVLVSTNFYIDVSCPESNPFNYEIRASDVTFDVQNGQITNVVFAKTGEPSIDDILSQPTFKLNYRTSVESQKPTP